MDVHRIQELIDRVSASTIYSPYITGPVPEQRIAAVEKLMGHEFCLDYVEYLKAFGKIELHTNDFFGIAINRSDDEGGQVARETEYFFKEVLGRKKEKMTLLMDDESEWYVTLDHETQQTVPYDPFSKTFVIEMKMPLEEFLVENIQFLLEL